MTVGELVALLKQASDETSVVLQDEEWELDLEIRQVYYEGRGPRIVLQVLATRNILPGHIYDRQ